MPPQVAQILNNTEKHLHNMFLAGAIMAALSCFARADYNLPMFAFLYIMWDQDDVSMARKVTVAERQSEADLFDGSRFAGRCTLAVLLGASLVVRRNGQVAGWPPQLCDPDGRGSACA